MDDPNPSMTLYMVLSDVRLIGKALHEYLGNHPDEITWDSAALAWAFVPEELVVEAAARVTAVEHAHGCFNGYMIEKVRS